MIAFLHILAEGEPSGIGALGIDPMAIVAQAITFLLFLWLLKKFALEKIVHTLEDRRKIIDDGILLGREMEKEKSELDARVTEALKQARADADKILADAQVEASERAKQSEAATKRKVEQMLEDAKARIETELREARKQLEGEMINLVIAATETLISQKLDPAKDNELIAKALKEAER